MATGLLHVAIAVNTARGSSLRTAVVRTLSWSCNVRLREVPSRDMSTAFEHDPPLSEVERNKRIGTEVRVEMARRGVKQTTLAREVFGQSQQWFWDRISGRVPFSVTEILDVADYLGVDVVTFLVAGRPSPQGGQHTVAYVTPYLASSNDSGQRATPPRTGHLSLVA